MSDLSAAIQPKADQLTADDLIAGPITLKITGVTVVKTPEQPVAISYDGDGGKPWKPCKSMTRVLVQMWGPDSAKFTGRSVTLYRDAGVKWGGLEVGGIRISHMSHIQGSQTMALTITRGSKKPFTVKPLVEAKALATKQPQADGPDPNIQRAADFVAAINERQTRAELDQFIANPAFQRAMGGWENAKPDLYKQVDDAVADRIIALEEATDEAP